MQTRENKDLSAQRALAGGRLRSIALAAGLCAAAVGTALVAIGQDVSAFKLTALSSEPLYAAGAGQKPTLTLALSVEFPTVGAMYTGGTDYAVEKEYLGYFDANSCYRYVNDADATRRRFDRTGPANNHGCGGSGFSGNFMNWATGSAIDALRLGLSGGDRIVDEIDLTVLQRAVLPNTSVSNNFWNGGNFPSKQLPATLAADAVPASLRGRWTGTIYVANCLDRVHFGTSATGSCAAPGNNSNLGINTPQYESTALSSDNFFYARVRVCESDRSGALTDPRSSLCQRYPNGRYKPVGNVQKYSDRIRVAAFGYLMDQRVERYGGVLRAPMKYVGPKGFDANGSPLGGPNRAAEWDANSGVLALNPDDAAEGISGVLNYLNRFGRTGPAAGMYKTYDPINELYYEALRYLQGKPPTDEATKHMTDGMKDGFPVYTDWVDPHANGSPTKNYACLKNNIMTIGDVNTHYDKYIPGNTIDDGIDRARPVNDADNEPDFRFWTNVVGSFASNGGMRYDDPNGGTASRTANNPNPISSPERPFDFLAGLGDQTYGNHSNYYIAGMAYWANTHDIRGAQWTANGGPAKQRPGMRVKTYALDVDENHNEVGGSENANRMRSKYFLAAKYGGFKDSSGFGNPFVTKDGMTIDNGGWERPGTPRGDALTFYLASSPQLILQGLDEMFANIASSANNIAGGSVSAQEVGPGGAAIYQASFNPDRWSGDVVAKPLVPAAGGTIDVGDVPLWSAAPLLDQANPELRKIFVGKVDRAAVAATELRWNQIESGASSTDARLKQQLDRPAPGSPADGLGEKRLDFIRGVRSDEGSLFRQRASRLGDVINSGVVYAGAPSQRYSTEAYRSFHDAYKSRPAAVYAGANDGMLHAFDAATGAELFAYIPSWLGARLSLLTSPTYGTSAHQSFVDATPRVAEAEIVSGGTSTWKTVLVGGTGAGGQGVYALDVSNPAAFDAGKVLWEFTDRDDPDLGNVVGRPQILRLRTSASNATTPTYRSFAVVAGGVNNTAPDGHASTSGKPALFLLDLSKSPGADWVLGTNYFKLSLPVNAAVAANIAPGVIEFRATSGPAGEVQRIYVGDLHGNLWKFDFSLPTSQAQWTSKYLSPFVSGDDPLPLYVAKDALGVRQPISMPPSLISGPAGSVIVSFGTGKYLEGADNQISASTQVQSVYALYDDDRSQTENSAGIAGRGRLARGEVAANGSVGMPDFLWGHATSDGDKTQRSGWYFDFVARGERQVSSAAGLGTALIFGSLIPPDATDPCGLGSGNQYVLNIATGKGSSQVSTLGLFGEPLVLNAGATYSDSDSAGQRYKTVTGTIIGQGSGGTGRVKIDSELLKQKSLVGRLSWRRITNYDDLHSQP
jgi:type IV pilus assembly protein PilY1